jgi:hypothetical protein
LVAVTARTEEKLAGQPIVLPVPEKLPVFPAAATLSTPAALALA